MRLAIPIWQERISPVLDSASRLLVVDLENQKEISRFEIYLDECDLTRTCQRIEGIGVDVLICSAVSRPFARMLEIAGIQLIHDISGAAEDVIHAYSRGDLGRGNFSMPGRERLGKHALKGAAHQPAMGRRAGKGKGRKHRGHSKRLHHYQPE